MMSVTHFVHQLVRVRHFHIKQCKMFRRMILTLITSLLQRILSYAQEPLVTYKPMHKASEFYHGSPVNRLEENFISIFKRQQTLLACNTDYIISWIWVFRVVTTALLYIQFVGFRHCKWQVRIKFSCLQYKTLER